MHNTIINIIHVSKLIYLYKLTLLNIIFFCYMYNYIVRNCNRNDKKLPTTIEVRIEVTDLVRLEFLCVTFNLFYENL